jgi:dephospho-CoA kinase
MQAALTGGMGSGKTFVLSCFRELGWTTVECDAITRDLLTNDATVSTEVRARFGNGVFDKSGAIDRKALAAVVFADEARLQALEELLHPLVRREWTRIINSNANKPAIVEIPLLFEKKLEKLFNISVCVTVSEPTQIARLAGRGFTKAEALARISRQMPLREKELRANFVILNNGNTDYTRAQVARLNQKIAYCD